MVTRKYRLRVTDFQQVLNRFSTDYCNCSLRDFSVFTAYAITAAVEMSQPRP